MKECDDDIRKVKDELASKKRRWNLKRRSEGLADIRSEDIKTRRVAVRILERIAGKSMIPVLTEVLNDPDPESPLPRVKGLHRLIGETLPHPKVSGNGAGRRRPKTVLNIRMDLNGFFRKACGSGPTLTFL